MHAHTYAHKNLGGKVTKNIWNIQVLYRNNQINLIFAMKNTVFRTNTEIFFCYFSIFVCLYTKEAPPKGRSRSPFIR